GFLINSFDRVERTQIDLTGRTFQFLHYDISAFTARKFATTNYQFAQFENGEPVFTNEFLFSAVKIALRYAYKEKMVQALHNTFFVSTAYPVLFAQVTQGFKNIFGSRYNFTKAEAKIKFYFSTKAIGDIAFQIAAGYILGELPQGDLFAGRGNYQIIGLYSGNSFQTMRLNEFYSDRYVALFYQQDLKTLLFRSRKFQPKPLLVINATIGTLGNKSLHHNTDFKTLDKGFIETGLIINNIISKQYFGVARLQLGVGAFYRLGYYMLPNPIDNVAFKVNFGISF
ncbi:MAG: hypothetical protein LH629_04285, partial [Ignavibacteria bacterium]|nr:hypothetical protein [Ignavibacteria bacterium]